MLEIRDLHARAAAGSDILRGVHLSVQAGEVHAVMGPNGSGKSTLAGVLAGRETFQVTRGTVTWMGRDLLAMAPDERAREGLFLAFQYPVEVPGVGNQYFVRTALNAIRRHRGQPELDAMDFLELARPLMRRLGLDEAFMNRAVNVEFSGGEKKRNEVYQMTMIEPRLAVLDEIDSGLDIDALKVVAEGVNALRRPDRAFLVITHYQRLLDYIEPDRVHVLMEGRIAESGDKGLARELERRGYGWLAVQPPEAARR